MITNEETLNVTAEKTPSGASVAMVPKETYVVSAQLQSTPSSTAPAPLMKSKEIVDFHPLTPTHSQSSESFEAHIHETTSTVHNVHDITAQSISAPTLEKPTENLKNDEAQKSTEEHQLLNGLSTGEIKSSEEHVVEVNFSTDIAVSKREEVHKSSIEENSSFFIQKDDTLTKVNDVSSESKSAEPISIPISASPIDSSYTEDSEKVHKDAVTNAHHEGQTTVQNGSASILSNESVETSATNITLNICDKKEEAPEVSNISKTEVHDESTKQSTITEESVQRANASVVCEATGDIHVNQAEQDKTGLPSVPEATTTDAVKDHLEDAELAATPAKVRVLAVPLISGLISTPQGPILISAGLSTFSPKMDSLPQPRPEETKPRDDKLFDDDDEPERPRSSAGLIAAAQAAAAELAALSQAAENELLQIRRSESRKGSVTATDGSSRVHYDSLSENSLRNSTAIDFTPQNSLAENIPDIPFDEKPSAPISVEADALKAAIAANASEDIHVLVYKHIEHEYSLPFEFKPPQDESPADVESSTHQKEKIDSETELIEVAVFEQKKPDIVEEISTEVFSNEDESIPIVVQFLSEEDLKKETVINVGVTEEDEIPIAITTEVFATTEKKSENDSKNESAKIETIIFEGKFTSEKHEEITSQSAEPKPEKKDTKEGTTEQVTTVNIQKENSDNETISVEKFTGLGNEISSSITNKDELIKADQSQTTEVAVTNSTDAQVTPTPIIVIELQESTKAQELPFEFKPPIDESPAGDDASSSIINLQYKEQHICELPFEFKPPYDESPDGPPVIIELHHCTHEEHALPFDFKPPEEPSPDGSDNLTKNSEKQETEESKITTTDENISKTEQQIADNRSLLNSEKKELDVVEKKSEIEEEIRYQSFNKTEERIIESSESQVQKTEETIASKTEEVTKSINVEESTNAEIIEIKQSETVAKDEIIENKQKEDAKIENSTILDAVEIKQSAIVTKEEKIEEKEREVTRNERTATLDATEVQQSEALTKKEQIEEKEPEVSRNEQTTILEIAKTKPEEITLKEETQVVNEARPTDTSVKQEGIKDVQSETKTELEEIIKLQEVPSVEEKKVEDKVLSAFEEANNIHFVSETATKSDYIALNGEVSVAENKTEQQTKYVKLEKPIVQEEEKQIPFEKVEEKKIDEVTQETAIEKPSNVEKMPEAISAPIESAKSVPPAAQKAELTKKSTIDDDGIEWICDDSPKKNVANEAENKENLNQITNNTQVFEEQKSIATDVNKSVSEALDERSMSFDIDKYEQRMNEKTQEMKDLVDKLFDKSAEASKNNAEIAQRMTELSKQSEQVIASHKKRVSFDAMTLGPIGGGLPSHIESVVLGKGILSSPTGVDILPDGNILVTDKEKGIFVFSIDGAIVKHLENENWKDPCAPYAHRSYILLVQSVRNAEGVWERMICKFSLDLTLQSRIECPIWVKEMMPSVVSERLCVSPAENIYLTVNADTFTGLYELTPGGQWTEIEYKLDERFTDVCAFCIIPPVTQILVIEGRKNYVHMYSIIDSQLAERRRLGVVERPGAIAQDEQGNLFVLNKAAACIFTVDTFSWCAQKAVTVVDQVITHFACSRGLIAVPLKDCVRVQRYEFKHY